MPAFSGRYKYLEPGDRVAHSGVCQFSFDETALILAPASGPPISCDLGDIDELSPGDYELLLKLYTGRAIALSQFGKAFQNLVHDLTAAYRDRLVQCLLLEDLRELVRVEGWIRLESAERDLSRPAELRLHGSNLAVLAAGATGFQWRLADLDEIVFDEAAYSFRLRSGRQQLTVTKLGKRTSEFNAKLRAAVGEHAENSAQHLRNLFPFLDPDQFQDTARLMKEGHAVAVSRLEAIHPRAGRALAANAVDAALKPYFEFLKQRTSPDGLYAGFKLTRPEPGQQAPLAPEQHEPLSGQGLEEHAETGDPIADDVLYWFFFPLRPDSGPVSGIAWEACSKSGRATYVFRAAPNGAGVQQTVETLNRALVALNFRREPIYLPDDALETDPGYRRYAIAARRLPFLQELRRSFIGRAIHTSAEAWQRQILDLAADAATSR